MVCFLFVEFLPTRLSGLFHFSMKQIPGRTHWTAGRTFAEDRIEKMRKSTRVELEPTISVFVWSYTAHVLILYAILSNNLSSVVNKNTVLQTNRFWV
jgi:hypothetical protein